MSSRLTGVYGGKNYFLRAISLVGGDMDIVNIYILFIILYLELYHHTISHTVSLYHYITVSIGKAGDIAHPYNRHIPLVDIEVHTRVPAWLWRCVNDSPVHVQVQPTIDRKVSQMIPSAQGQELYG